MSAFEGDTRKRGGGRTPPLDVPDLDVRIDSVNQARKVRRLLSIPLAFRPAQRSETRSKRTTVTASVSAARQLTPPVYL